MLAALCVVVLTPKPDPTLQAIEPTPADVSALHTFEARVRAAICTISSTVVQLDGGNDALNSVVPFTNPEYVKLPPGADAGPARLVRLTDSPGLGPFRRPSKC